MPDKSLAAWVKQWQKAAPLLQNQRDLEIRQSVPWQEIEILSDAFEFALLNSAAPHTSGLVEYQSIVKKLPR